MVFLVPTFFSYYTDSSIKSFSICNFVNLSTYAALVDLSEHDGVEQAQVSTPYNMLKYNVLSFKSQTVVVRQ